MSKATLDMTTGSPAGLLIRFSLPTLAGNVLNQVYTITDSVIVGRRLGETALAAVGCTMPVILLVASMIIGVNVGVSILLSQSMGRRDIGGMRRIFCNSLYFGFILALAAAVIGSLLTRPILLWMGTPAGPLDDAVTYLRISFVSTVCPMAYYLLTCAFRGMGDSSTPLWCLIASVISNIILDLLFVIGFDMGVAGSAWATALAQAMSAVFSAALLWRKYPEMRFTRDMLAPDLTLFKEIARVAAPVAVQSAFNNLGNIVAQSAVNIFGKAAMAAYTAGGRIGTLALMPMETVGSSLSIYAGQNHGAEKPDRVRAGVNAALRIVLVLSIILAAVLLLGGQLFSRIFLEEPSQQMLDISWSFLLITAVPGILGGVMFVYQQVLRGVDRPNQAMVGGFTQLAAKIAVAALGAWVFVDLDVVWLAWPISYLAGTAVPFLYYRLRYLRGPLPANR